MFCAELLEFCEGGRGLTGVDGFGSAGDSFPEIGGDADGFEGGSGVMRAAFSFGSPASDSSMRATTDSPVVVSSSIPSVP